MPPKKGKSLEPEKNTKKEAQTKLFST